MTEEAKGGPRRWASGSTGALAGSWVIRRERLWRGEIDTNEQGDGVWDWGGLASRIGQGRVGSSRQVWAILLPTEYGVEKTHLEALFGTHHFKRVNLCFTSYCSK